MLVKVMASFVQLNTVEFQNKGEVQASFLKVRRDTGWIHLGEIPSGVQLRERRAWGRPHQPSRLLISNHLLREVAVVLESEVPGGPIRLIGSKIQRIQSIEIQVAANTMRCFQDATAAIDLHE